MYSCLPEQDLSILFRYDNLIIKIVKIFFVVFWWQRHYRPLEVLNFSQHALGSSICVSEDVSVVTDVLSGDSAMELALSRITLLLYLYEIRNLNWIPSFFKFLGSSELTTGCFSTYWREPSKASQASTPPRFVWLWLNLAERKCQLLIITTSAAITTIIFYFVSISLQFCN